MILQIETVELCYSAADHLINPARRVKTCWCLVSTVTQNINWFDSVDIVIKAWNGRSIAAYCRLSLDSPSQHGSVPRTLRLHRDGCSIRVAYILCPPGILAGLTMTDPDPRASGYCSVRSMLWSTEPWALRYGCCADALWLSSTWFPIMGSLLSF